MRYKIWYGLGGGFGGAREFEIIDCVSEEEAETIGFNLACDEYDRYAGLHGLRDLEEIADDNDLCLEIPNDLDEAGLIYNEERESWLDYRVELV